MDFEAFMKANANAWDQQHHQVNWYIYTSVLDFSSMQPQQELRMYGSVCNAPISKERAVFLTLARHSMQLRDG